MPNLTLTRSIKKSNTDVYAQIQEQQAADVNMIYDLLLGLSQSIENLKRTQQSFINQTQSLFQDTKTNAEKYLFVKVDSSSVKVCFNNIKYIEGLKDYAKIYVNEKPFITKSTIKNIESKLPSDKFVRVHKSYIISLDMIDKIEYNHIFIGQKQIPIGMQFKESFYTKINSLRL